MKRLLPILFVALALAWFAEPLWSDWNIRVAVGTETTGAWTDANHWSKGSVPVAGEDCNLVAQCPAMDCNRIPVSGTLSSLGTNAEGYLTVNGAALITSSINATTILAGTAYDWGVISYTGASGTNTVTATTIRGGTVYAYGVKVETSGTSTTNITANVFGGGQGSDGIRQNSGVISLTGNATGGSLTEAYGIKLNGEGSLTINGPSTITGGTHSSAPGIRNDTYGLTVTFNSANGGVNLVNSTKCMAYTGKPPIWNMTAPNINYCQMDANVGAVGSEVKQTAKFLIAADPNMVKSGYQIFPTQNGVMTTGGGRRTVNE